jgi:GntR family transcriptional repressor for pyruvate dehydrogenase complex
MSGDAKALPHAPLHREKLSETVAQRLREQIRDGRVAPGERLPGHRDIADAFSVGLSSVREAISMLASEGLIETRAGRGTFVRAPGDTMTFDAGGRELTRRELEEVLEAREVLELQLVVMAANQASDDEIARLKACLATMEAAVDDASAYAQADLELHFAIAESAHNRFLRQALEQIRLLMRENMHVSMVTAQRRKGAVQASLGSHRRLVAAIESGEADVARDTLFEIMSRHHEFVLGWPHDPEAAQAVPDAAG